MSFGEGVFLSVRDLFLEGKKAFFDLKLNKTSLKISGDKRSKVRGRGMDFFESRPYVLKDEIKNIDWKVSARLNELYTKIYTEEKDRPVYLVVDLRSSMFFGSVNCFKSVLAGRIAAQLATAAINGGDHVSGLVFNEETYEESPMGASKKSLAKLFGLIAEGSKKNTQQGSFDWEVVLRRASAQSPGTLVFILSDFLGLNDSHKPLLHQLKKRADVFALRISDPLEQHLPSIGPVAMVYGHQEIFFDSYNKGIKKRYEIEKKKQEQGVARLFSSLAIPLVDFSTALDPSIHIKMICGR